MSVNFTLEAASSVSETTTTATRSNTQNVTIKKETIPDKNKPLEVFHAFDKLPPEARQMIWIEAFPKGRVVEVHLRTVPNGNLEWLSPSNSCHPPAALLGVCKESRAEYKRKNVLISREVVFTRTFIKNKIAREYYTACYFNADVDTLYISSGLISGQRMAIDLLSNLLMCAGRIRFLACGHFTWFCLLSDSRRDAGKKKTLKGIMMQLWRFTLIANDPFSGGDISKYLRLLEVIQIEDHPAGQHLDRKQKDASDTLQELFEVYESNITESFGTVKMVLRDGRRVRRGAL